MESDKENRRQDDKQQPPENKTQASRDSQEDDGKLVVLSLPISILTVEQNCLKLRLT